MVGEAVKWKSEKYRRWIASKPCLQCGASDVQCAHITAGRHGMGMRPPDFLTIPLCIRCHPEFDANEKADAILLARAFVAAAEYFFEWRELP